MTVSFIGISKEKKELVENFSGKRPDVSKKFGKLPILGYPLLDGRQSAPV